MLRAQVNSSFLCPNAQPNVFTSVGDLLLIMAERDFHSPTLTPALAQVVAPSSPRALAAPPAPHLLITPVSPSHQALSLVGCHLCRRQQVLRCACPSQRAPGTNRQEAGLGVGDALGPGAWPPPPVTRRDHPDHWLLWGQQGRGEAHGHGGRDAGPQ